MIKVPCEIVIWNFLPSLRREIVKTMIKNGIKRKEIAKLFDISEAAVSYYLKSKRGTSFRFERDIQREIEKLASKITKSRNPEQLIFEICRICYILKNKKLFCKLHRKENPVLIKCNPQKGICLRR